MLEADAPSSVARDHLDRCLTCRACETTCPSGVAYGELAEIGRDFVEARGRRAAGGPVWRATRWYASSLRRNVSRFSRAWARSFALSFQPISRARSRASHRRPAARRNHARRVVVLDGCVQRVTTPEVNAALARILDAADVKVVRVADETCCGSLALHSGTSRTGARRDARQRRRAVRSRRGDEAIISTASGCGVTVKDYGRLLADDPLYAERAQWVAEHTCDARNTSTASALSCRGAIRASTVAWHAPCTLQHGQRVNGVVEALLRRAGYELVPVAEAHLCCGSAGTYSVLQPALAEDLRRRKLGALTRRAPT